MHRTNLQAPTLTRTLAASVEEGEGAVPPEEEATNATDAKIPNALTDFNKKGKKETDGCTGSRLRPRT